MKHKYFIIGLLLLVVILFDGFFNENIKHYLFTERSILQANGPEMAALQNYYMTADSGLNMVPHNRLFSAYLQTREMSKHNLENGSKSDLEWTETGSNVGGRTRAMMWDPNDPENAKVWAGSVTGGLWYNNDINDSASIWQPVDGFWPNLSISCLVSDPNDSQVFYAGTGEYQTAREIYRESSGVGIGIWKSIDGGETWEILPSTQGFKYISDIVIKDESGQSVVYAGVVSGLYCGVNHNSEPDEGLYRSVDGGGSWQQVLPDVIYGDEPYAPADIEISANGRIFVGTLKNENGEGGATILFSDFGTSNSWSIYSNYESIILYDPSYPVPGRVEIACSPSNPNRVYAIIGAGWLNTANFNYSRGRYIIRSNNGGQSWYETNIPENNPEWANIAWHSLAIAVNPTNPDVLFVGGKDIWRSTNAGYNWTRISDWNLYYSGGGDDYVHCDNHQFLFDENNMNNMLIAGDGGIFWSENIYSSDPVFIEKNNNYNTLQFYTCDIFPNAGIDNFLGGLQDNASLFYSGDPYTLDNVMYEGDGAYCFFDENEPEIMIVSSYYNQYKLYLNGNESSEFGDYGTGIFINPADYDSENNILFANAVKFSVSYPNQLLRVSGIPGNPDEEIMYLSTGAETWYSHVRVSPHSPQGASTLFLGTKDGEIFRVQNAHYYPTVTEINTSELPEANISCIEVGASEDILLVTFSNYGVNSVWQTYDGGDSWISLEGNLPDMPVRWALFHPQNENMIMLATEIGIWTTQDASTGFIIWNPEVNFPKVRVDMVRMRKQDNTVLAASHGRGLIYATWNIDIGVNIKEATLSNSLNVFPNPADDFIQITCSMANPVQIKIIDQSGRQVLNGFIDSEKSIDVTNWQSGVYYVVVDSRQAILSKKIIIY